MRRSRVALVASAALVAGAMLGPVASSALTPNDKACRSGITIPYDNGETVAYEACRFDKLEAQLNDVARPAPSESPTATPTPTPTPTDSPAPTVTPTTTTPSPTDEPTSASPSPTPTPTATTPSTGFPTAATTGVPAGTNLTAYTGPMTITTPGTVIDAKTVNGSLTIKAADVKITNSQINGTVATDEESSGYSFTIADSNVSVGSKAGTGVGAVNFTATRVEVTGGNRSMNCWHDCTVTDSYVHGQFTDSTGVYHESGIRMGARGVIRHNTIACTAPDVAPDAGCSAALSGYGDFGTVENMTIDSNLFVAGSGGYCSYGGSTSGKPYPNAHDIKFTNNVWQRGTQKSDHGTFICGYYGPVTAFNKSAPGNVWSGNKYDDGSPVAAA